MDLLIWRCISNRIRDCLAPPPDLGWKFSTVFSRDYPIIYDLYTIIYRPIIRSQLLLQQKYSIRPRSRYMNTSPLTSPNFLPTTLHLNFKYAPI